MRRIPIPSTVELIDPVSGQTMGGFAFRQFIEGVLLADKSWGVTFDKLLVAMDLRAGLVAVPQGEPWCVPDAPWSQMCEVLRKPSAPYNPTSMVQLGSYFRAVFDAPHFEDNATHPRAAQA